MIQIKEKFKFLFYISSVLLGFEIAFFVTFITNPFDGIAIHVAILILAASIPCLVGSCLGFIFGYEEPAKNLLQAGAYTFVAWLFFLLISYSILASLVFGVMTLVCYKMLEYHHSDLKKTDNQDLDGDGRVG